MNAPDCYLDDALNTYPLAPTPPGLHRRIMAAVSADARLAHAQQPKLAAFHLDFLDLALPGFVAFFSAFVLCMGMWAYFSIDPLRWYELRLTLAAIFRNVDPASIWIALCAGLGVSGLSIGLLAALVLGRSAWTVQTA